MNMQLFFTQKPDERTVDLMAIYVDKEITFLSFCFLVFFLRGGGIVHEHIFKQKQILPTIS